MEVILNSLSEDENNQVLTEKDTQKDTAVHMAAEKGYTEVIIPTGRTHTITIPA